MMMVKVTTPPRRTLFGEHGSAEWVERQLHDTIELEMVCGADGLIRTHHVPPSSSTCSSFKGDGVATDWHAVHYTHLTIYGWRERGRIVAIGVKR